MFELRRENSKIGINIPTTLDEVVKVLPDVVNNVKLPEHYCIIAMVMKTDLFTLSMSTTNSGKDKTVDVKALFVKANSPKMPIDIELGDKVIVERSSLERSTHLHIPISASLGKVVDFLNEDANKELRRSIANNTYGKSTIIQSEKSPVLFSSKDKIYVMEFKIIPVGDIRAAIPYNAKVSDPFKVINN